MTGDAGCVDDVGALMLGELGGDGAELLTLPCRDCARYVCRCGEEQPVIDGRRAVWTVAVASNA